MKLDERDRRILALVGTQSRSVSTVASGLDADPGDLEDRMADLAENGLLYDLGDGRYRRTESGRRVLVTSSPGPLDERIDTPADVEQALEGFDLGPDEADAVRHAFAFLRYWGRVTGEEIIDAVYSEAPAGRRTAEAWWEEVVRDPLAGLPGVEPPSEAGEPWRYTGAAEAGERFADGRRVLSATHPVYGDVKHALESLDLTGAEREAARAAFGYLYRRGEATDREIREAVYPEHDAGYSSPERWWNEVVAGAFEALPGVERTGPDAWRHGQS